MPYEEFGNKIYYFGEDDAPAGAGWGAQIFSDIVKKAKESTPAQPFEDQFFWADSKIVEGIDLTYTDSDGNKQPIKTEWRRPTDISKAMFNLPPLFHGPFNEFGIDQGDVGDCWFLAVTADVSLKPELIKMIIPEDNSTVGFDAGVFHFRFWCRGKWIDVVVDDKLLCQMNDDDTIQTTLFTKPTKNGGFWVPLLEKAYAKLYGKYKDIDGGCSSDAMMDYTGGYIHHTDHKNKDLKEILTKASETSALVSMGTKTAKHIPSDLLLYKGRSGSAASSSSGDEGNAEEKPKNKKGGGSGGVGRPEGTTKTGMVLGHEYSILGTQIVNKKDNNESITLVRLRNPWGDDTEWNGAFSDPDDDSWASVTQDLRADVGKRNDGEFWIQFDDLKTYLDDMDICHWKGLYRGETTTTTEDGRTILIENKNFGVENSGPAPYLTSFMGKHGYFVQLKPGVKDPFNVTMQYKDYKVSGNNPTIPNFGFYVFWDPNMTKPDEDFFNNAKVNENVTGSEDRSQYFQRDLTGGIALVIPWMGVAPEYDNIPYYLRIATFGEVKKYPLDE